MSLHTSTRVPVDDAYAALIGKAVYVFAYYEWTLIYIIEHLNPGFVNKYSREKVFTSGNVRDELQETINYHTDFTKVSSSELQVCCNDFDSLIVKRNALFHAHPCTDSDGKQILAYQTKTSKPLSDMQWPEEEVEKVISDFDVAACNAGVILDKLR